MEVEPWQVPLLVMAAVVLPPAAVGFVGWRRRSRRLRAGGAAALADDASGPGAATESRKLQITRTGVFAVLTVALLAVSFLTIGPEQASVLATAATTVSAAVSAILGVQSFLAIQEIKDRDRQGQGDGATTTRPGPHEEVPDPPPAIGRRGPSGRG